ncbi:MAG TPA: SprT family zinc-dependent metalloprotease, partial [Elusimicrobiota bacterium]|nr:SprT family zinc-dependent metalloprotease [Elusimicrobiota bacterium]
KTFCRMPFFNIINTPADDRLDSYQLTRRRGQRTISLRLSPDGTLRVSAGRWAPRYEIERFLRRQSDWIARHRAKLHEIGRRHPRKTFSDGERFLVHGTEVPLRVVPAPQPVQTASCEMREGELRVTARPGASREEIGSALREWYGRQAFERVSAIAGTVSPRIGVAPRRISVGDQKTRWGSCSSRGSLRFNWRLILMPMGCLEYVVVHELAHLKVLDHSPRFWRVVGSILPDYKNRQKIMRRFAAGFGFDGFA